MNRTLVLRPDELTDVHLTRWRQIHESAARFASPYFTPEFTQAVGSVRRDVEVAVLEESGEVVGFFPFQRGLLGFAKPVGGQLSDDRLAGIGPS